MIRHEYQVKKLVKLMAGLDPEKVEEILYLVYPDYDVAYVDSNYDTKYIMVHRTPEMEFVVPKYKVVFEPLEESGTILPKEMIKNLGV